jgi:hypothetical protein
LKRTLSVLVGAIAMAALLLVGVQVAFNSVRIGHLADGVSPASGLCWKARRHWRLLFGGG